ncbi:hypothetical protein QEO94_07270 [Kingella negevensis]|uniref:hypothetical protein n=1 Tax=Kingella negevensis TaxID=1522312 RepID=UPI002543DA30|nr:hypothetical protein [Kingella negevensis]WII92444.1 hypothetical protein QEO94_07270 [Kingella negevensis]
MNYLAQFQAVFAQEKRAVAKLTVQHNPNQWQAQTSSGGVTVQLTGTGYTVGQTVFYDVFTRRILESTADVTVVELRV